MLDEAVRVEQVLHADRAARDLVFVRGADAAAGRADLVARGRRSRAPGRAPRDTAAPAGRRARSRAASALSTPALLELADLLQQRGRRHDDAVADQHGDARAQDAGRNQAQHGLPAADDERVTGVVAALEAHDAGRLLGQPVDDLALAFIAPLGADDDDVLAHAADLPRMPSRLGASQHVGQLAQVQREAGGRPRAAERLADAVVAAAVADRVRLARGEHREDRDRCGNDSRAGRRDRRAALRPAARTWSRARRAPSAHSRWRGRREASIARPAAPPARVRRGRAARAAHRATRPAASTVTACDAGHVLRAHRLEQLALLAVARDAGAARKRAVDADVTEIEMQSREPDAAQATTAAARSTSRSPSIDGSPNSSAPTCTTSRVMPGGAGRRAQHAAGVAEPVDAGGRSAGARRCARPAA